VRTHQSCKDSFNAVWNLRGSNLKESML
jgi:hypothetical protein